MNELKAMILFLNSGQLLNNITTLFLLIINVP